VVKLTVGNLWSSEMSSEKITFVPMALLRSILLTCAAAILVMHSLLPHLHQNEADNNVAELHADICEHGQITWLNVLSHNHSRLNSPDNYLHSAQGADASPGAFLFCAPVDASHSFSCVRCLSVTTDLPLQFSHAGSPFAVRPPPVS